MKRSVELGFTLIELLAVVAVISVLAAIGLPQFNSSRMKAFDSRTLNDLYNAAVAQDAYFAEYEHYVDCIGGVSCRDILGSFEPSPGVNVALFRVPASGGIPEHFTGRAFHPQGSRNDLINAYLWDSYRGGLQE